MIVTKKIEWLGNMKGIYEWECVFQAREQKRRNTKITAVSYAN